MSVEIEEMLRRYGQELDRLPPLPTAAEVRARAEQLSAREGAGYDASEPYGRARERGYLVEAEDHQMVAFARPRAPRRRAIAVLAAVAAVIAVTVGVAVTRPGSHRQSNPVGPAPSSTTVTQPTQVVPPPSPTAVAQPQLYWQDAYGIGRANLDGTGITRNLIPTGSTPTCGVGTLAMDHNYLYWAAPTFAGGVDRVRRDGTGLDQGFITTGTPDPAGCVAVDGAHVYWTSQYTIGRANLDGTGVNENFISGLNRACGLAVDGAHIYWASLYTGAIGRANLDGTGVNQDFISVATCAIVVDGAHIYWDNGATGPIGRANLDGTGVNESFITPGGWGGLPCAHDSTYLYWTSGLAPAAGGSIGRARLDGTGGVQEDFITGLNNPSGCAIGP
jgi:hypothetical protein